MTDVAIYRASVPDRMQKRIELSDGCWLWHGARDSRGYGRTWADGRSVLAHRAVYQFVTGEALDGLVLCHHCDNPSCVRPDHLFPGTQADNLADMRAKGRDHTMRPVCRNGHERTPDNQRQTSRGRVCRDCERAVSRRKYLRRKGVAA